jgi:DNA-binding MltR family transcriptional regulator
MTAWLVTSPEDMAVLAELNQGASDRAVGIIAASLVEIHLTQLIKAAFIREVKLGDKETVQEFIFRSTGPLGAFAAKTRLAYLMGMISPEAFKDLEIMREIRNRFAHRTDVGSFSHQEISSRCFNFAIVDKYVIDPPNGVHGNSSAFFGFEVPGATEKLKDPKERYTTEAQILSIGIQHATVEAKPYSPNF